MVMLPITATQRSRHPGSRFLIVLVVQQRPATEALPRILNQSKKRQSPARFGRYLGLIEAQWRNAPALVALNPSSLARIFQFVKILATTAPCAEGAARRLERRKIGSG